MGVRVKVGLKDSVGVQSGQNGRGNEKKCSGTICMALGNCMYTDSVFLKGDTNHKWHVSRPNACNRVDPNSTDVDATEARTRTWINAGYRFEINPYDMPCWLFVLYTQTNEYGHY